MPGILIMNSSAADAAAPRDGESKKRDHEGRLINGTSNSVAVAAPAAAPTPAQWSELPPEIAHIPSDAYHPLSTLLARMSQECYNGLGEILQRMADIPLLQPTNGALPNGLGLHGSANSQDNAKANQQKKLLLLKFAQDNRAKFIKLLVLTEWGKKAAVDVSKLIDLFSWTREQSAHMEHIDQQLERIKIHSNSARLNNPDIATALEILSTGKASWMPSLDYIPPDPISSEHALKLLRYMNTSLSIRLNLHETLPRHLQNWRVGNGRATFVIDNEFEFDVISFVEDASDQWWFIDLRLLFTPAPSITVGSRFYLHLKNQADFIAKEKGLSGLFDFLHNFILTHKINVLRSEALSLARTGWAGSLKVEPVHRSLVVQYWTNRPGKKNWVEIGISTNKPKNGKVSWRGPPVPSLTVRWFRQGKEVEDSKLRFDWKALSMERIIKRVVARHTSDILRSTRDGLNLKTAPHVDLSETEPAQCTLKATLGTKTNSISLCLHSVTGNFILQPATAPSARAESYINQGREAVQIANILTHTLAQTLLGSIQKGAQQLGWQPLARQSLHLQLVKTAVNLDVLQFALYCPRGWSSRWAFAAVVHSSGETWWIAEIGSNGTSLDYVEQIKLDRPDGNSLPIDRKTLASLERVAVQLLSFRVTARQLAKERKSCTLQYELNHSGSSPATQRVVRRWVLHLQTFDLLAVNPNEQPWLEPDIAVTCEGLRVGGHNVWHIASGRMVKDVATQMHKLMAASSQNNFSFSKDGRFRILLSTPFGEDILGELRARLRDVNRLRSFATTLEKRGMRLGSSSLHRVQFYYGDLPHTAAVNFSSGTDVTVEISPQNPHHRILNLLSQVANDRMPTLPNIDNGATDALDRFCSTLIATRSVSKVLLELESRTPGNVRNPAIHVHAIMKYRLTYENPICSFDIRLQPKGDTVFWFVEDSFRARSQETLPTPERVPGHRRLETLQAKLKELYKAKGTGWFGTRNGMVVELDAVADALRKLDACVLSCKMEGGYKAPPPLEKTAPHTQPIANGHVAQGGQPRTQQQGQGQIRQQPGQAQAGARRQQPQQQQQQQQGQRAQQTGARQQQGRGGGVGGNASTGGGRLGQSKPDIIEID